LDTYRLMLLLQAVQLVWLVGLSLAAWLRKPGQEAAVSAQEAAASASQVRKDLEAAMQQHRDEVDERLGQQGELLSSIATHLQHVPSSEELATLGGTVKAIDERTRGMTEQIAGMHQGLVRLQEYLMHRK
jgi:hypothetical protein